MTKKNITIRAKAPLRLGLAGGGTDVSPYSDIYGGLVLNATINLYTHCIIEITDKNEVEIFCLEKNQKEKYKSQLSLPINGVCDLVKGVYNRVVKDFIHEPLSCKIITYSDVPPGSGLGASSTMTVCILKAFAEWLTLPLGDYDLARLAYEIERLDLLLSGGKQDQYAAAFGGINFMEFLPNNSVIVNPLKLKNWIIDELESSMLIYYTGASRSSSSIIEQQKNNALKGEKQTLDSLHQIKQSAIDMRGCLLRGDIEGFAQIIKKGWLDKKRLAQDITNPHIDHILDIAYQNGAISGKISGAGGGGFITLVTKPEDKYHLIQALDTLEGMVIPFMFSNGGPHGWTIYTDR